MSLQNPNNNQTASSVDQSTNKQYRLPLPKGIVFEHPDYPYWVGLADVLSKALLDGLLDMNDVRGFYKKFSTLNSDQKWSYLKNTTEQATALRSRMVSVLYQYDSEALKKKFERYLSVFPASMQGLVFEYLTTFTLPYPEFFDDLSAAMKYEEDIKNGNYENLDPYMAIEDLKLNALRLDDENKKAQARNARPITQSDIDELLNSTTEIKTELDKTPEYGFNPLVNQTEMAQNRFQNLGSGLGTNMQNMKRNMNSATVSKNIVQENLEPLNSVKINSNLFKPRVSLTEQLLNQRAQPNTNSMPKVLSQDKLNILKQSRNVKLK